jgi:phosphoribosylformylglycinamidine cyclo-ligase
LESYRSAGVDYDKLDAAKRMAITAGRQTEPYLQGLGFTGVPASRGQSAYVFRQGPNYFASVLECLGTKSVLAREYLDKGGQDHFDHVAYDTVAAVLNDLVSVGALPLVVHAYFAAGASVPPERYVKLVQGWQRACDDAHACWGGGETPTLAGLIGDQDIDLAGSATGIIPAGREPVLGDALEPGHDIILIASSGIHTNGITLARSIARKLDRGLRTTLPDGRDLGGALLTPSHLYTGLIAALSEQNIPVSAMTHLTGHGLRKIMRADAEVTYRVSKLPSVPAELSYLSAQADLPPAEAYATWNMGAGFGICCPPASTEAVLDCAGQLGYSALLAGRVEQGPKRVVLEPIGVTYDADTLRLSG